MYSLLKLERLNRHWSRAQVEEQTGIPQRSLENWEEGIAFPRAENIIALCSLYGKSPKELGLDKRGDIMGAGSTLFFAPQEGTPMSDIIRRAIFHDLGSKLSGLIDTWPKRDHHYEELQGEINQVLFDYNVLARQDSISEMSRREVLKSVGLVPIQLCAGFDGIINLQKAKADSDTLLKHCAAGIAACWSLRKSGEFQFSNDLLSEYIKILQQLRYSRSETHRKAAAGLLAQSFMLKGSLANTLASADLAIAFAELAIESSILASNLGTEAYANRMMAQFHYTAKKYEEALKFAERAEALIKLGNLDKLTQSWIYSGLTYCQAFNGQIDHSVTSLKLARDLFDPHALPPIYMQYSIGVLNNCGGLTSLRNGNYQEAADFFDAQMAVSGLGGVVEAKLDRAKTEVSRDDKERDMDLAVSLLTQGITGARERGLKFDENEANELYDLFRIAWPREDAIKKLGKDHFGVEK